MKPHSRDRELIAVILDDCALLRRRVAYFSTTEDSFVNDRSEEGKLAYDAIMSPVYRIAEDALHLSDGVYEMAPEYPWNEIRGFRNFVAHGYREVDRAIAWKVVSGDIPLLEQTLVRVLAELEE